MARLLELDGAAGEGGGQILRSALGLSLVTGQPFRIRRIRAGRARPGLLRQHLTAVHAAATIGNATVHGAGIGATELEFRPGRVVPGSYEFAIGGAGSTLLVLQAVLPALLCADRPSELTLRGGTHNPSAPPFDFFAQAFVPVLRKLGVTVELTLGRAGFHPAGGGELRARILPAPRLEPCELLQRIAPEPPRARVLLAQLERSIAERELAVIMGRLQIPAERTAISELESLGPGNAVLIELPSAELCELTVGFGTRGERAERVAAIACEQAEALLTSGVPVGPHLADQLLIPLAMAGGGRFRTLAPTTHLLTNLDLVMRFLPVTITATQEPQDAGGWCVEIA